MYSGLQDFRTCIELGRGCLDIEVAHGSCLGFRVDPYTGLGIE